MYAILISTGLDSATVSADLPNDTEAAGLHVSHKFLRSVPIHSLLIIGQLTVWYELRVYASSCVSFTNKTPLDTAKPCAMHRRFVDDILSLFHKLKLRF